MTTYDDKTNGAIESGRNFILPDFTPCDEVTFKASYVIASDIKCVGKIIALFDLVVLGSLEASEVDIKGRFVCLGNCKVSGSIIVQNEIWVNNIQAEKIEVHERIVAEEIEGSTIFADGSILVGKILAVKKFAFSHKNIICGETAYGAGRIAANTVITGEPLDLDNGVEAIISPSTYIPNITQSELPAIEVATETTTLISYGEMEYAPLGDFRGYLDFLISASCDNDEKVKFNRWKNTLNEAETTLQSGIDSYINVAILIWLTEIVASDYFKNWKKIFELFDAFENHFKKVVHTDKNAIKCFIESYNEWLGALTILNRYGALIDNTVYDVVFEMVVSNLGIKAKFISERFNEKGWKIHVK
jgi:hypothetical protein